MNSKKWLFQLQYFFLPIFLMLGLGAHAQAPLNASMEGQGSVFAANETKKVKDAYKKAPKKAHKKKVHHKAKKSAPKTHHKKATKSNSHKPSHKKHHKATKRVSHKAPVQHTVGEDRVIGKRPDGREIFEGPRGGQYYVNENGNKVYIKRDN